VRLIITILVAAAFTEATCQTRDNWFWPSVQVEKKFFNDLTVSMNAEARINENSTNLRGYFGELELNWKFNKYLSASGNYRLGGRQIDVSDYVKGQRITLYVYGKVKVSKFSLTNRAGILRQYLESRETPRDYIRDKLTLKYELTKKIAPLTYVEMFYRLDTEPGRIEEWRYAGGVDFDITKQHGIKAVYMLAKQVNVKNPNNRNVWALTYTFKFKSKKKESGED
jgi:hypothetical protein